MTEIELPQLHRRFHGRERYRKHAGYRLLPIRFLRLDDGRYLATNLVGERVVLARAELEAAADGVLPSQSPRYSELVSKHFILESGSDVALDLLAAKYRTKLDHLANFTGLHLFVVTLRCDHSCPYCQVSRVSSDRAAYDMSPETADRAVEMLFKSPSPRLKVEFQGGEPLLNFEIVKRVVEKVEQRNATEGRLVDFVIATNLANISDDILTFCRDHRVYISTSLDGPRELHNANRPRPGGDSYERAIDGIRRCREALGPRSVSALMTTTRASLAGR